MRFSALGQGRVRGQHGAGQEQAGQGRGAKVRAQGNTAQCFAFFAYLYQIPTRPMAVAGVTVAVFATPVTAARQQAQGWGYVMTQTHSFLQTY